MTKEQVFEASYIQGNSIIIPTQKLDRDVYLSVKKSYELIGGKWKGGKVMGFVFSYDPTELLEELRTGRKVDLKKEFQFFATPANIAKDLVKYANINEYDLILEPSAGQGAIIKAIQDEKQGATVHYCELMPINRVFLEKIPNTVKLTDNFLSLKMPPVFHKIIANPPFSKNQDIDHILLMYDLLAADGVLVSILSNHFRFASDNKSKNFRSFLKTVNADIHEIPPGSFKESGTNISASIIVIKKI